MNYSPHEVKPATIMEQILNMFLSRQAEFLLDKYEDSHYHEYRDDVRTCWPM